MKIVPANKTHHEYIYIYIYIYIHMPSNVLTCTLYLIGEG